MNVHHDGYRLADDERDPDGHVAVVAVQKTFDKRGKRYLYDHAKE